MSESKEQKAAQYNNAKPNLAAMANELLCQCRNGMLATHSTKHEDFPFASLVPFALDQQGRPLVFVSALATHTRNLKANGNASLLATAGASPTDARATLIGTLQPVPDAEHDVALETYLQRHPDARQWASFGDFSLLRMKIVDIYFVGGFGVMGWVKAKDYFGCSNRPG